MPKLTLDQTNFSAGELSPKMRGRSDVARYQNGAEVLENCTVDVHGGAVRRNGQRYLATAKLGGARKVRLVRYVFNESQAYMLEFGHLYIRFFTVDGAVILNAAGSAPLELVSPYTEDQIFEVTVRQGADTMFLFHQEVPQQRLRRVSAGLFLIQPVPWVVQPFDELGHLPPAQLSLSAATVGAGRTFSTGPVTSPGVPGIGVANPLNGGANVAFAAPASNGGLPITNYRVTATPGGLTANGPTSPIRITGLTNGVAYTFTVHATNSVGNSAESAASNVCTPNAALPSTAVNLAIAPVDFVVDKPNGVIAAIAGPTASCTGSAPPFHFAWVKRSGSANIAIVNGSGAQVTFSSNGRETSNYAILRCTATDNYGGVSVKDVNITVNHAASGGGV